MPRRTSYRQLALTDGLTGLANRRAFDDALAKEWSRCARSGSPLALLMLDVDYFKLFNDTYGHLGGDACLKRVAAAVGSCANRPGDLAARYGGEEFCLLLPETAPGAAATVAVKVVEAVRALGLPHEASSLGRVTVSVGLASVVPQESSAPQTLVEAADAQLYRAKEGGRNRYASEELVAPGPRADKRVVSRHNIVPSRTSFVGRAAEIAELEGALERGRLLTLAGPGGAGKTRLARELAIRVAPRYPDGVWFVDLTAAGSGEDAISRAIAAAALPSIAADITRDLLVRLLQDKQMRIVLDNCEHVIDEAAQIVNALLDETPGIEILATSREPLEVEGEVIHRVRLLDASESRRLFEERATAAGLEQATIDQQSTQIDELLRALEGLPLAVEIAASHMASLEPREVLERFRDRLATVPLRSRSAPARHRTLHALLDWSYDALPENEAALLRRLGVFAGGWTSEAALAVCGEGDGGIVALLDRLVNRSLVSREDGRYRLLEPTREYAVEKLEHAGETQRLRLRHAEYFSAYAAQGYREALSSIASIETHDRPELANYEAAMRTYFETDPNPEAAAEFLDRSQLVAELVWSSYSGFHAALERFVARDDLSPRARARFSILLADVWQHRGDPGSVELAAQARDAFAEIGDWFAWAYATNILHATSLQATGASAGVPNADFERAIAIAIAAGDRRLAAMLASDLALNIADAGDMPEALARLESALDLADPQDGTALGTILGNIAVARMRTQDYDGAIDALEKARRLTITSRPWRTGMMDVNLTHLHVYRGAYDHARSSLANAFAVIRTYRRRGLEPFAWDAAALLASRVAPDETTVRLAAHATAAYKGNQRQAFEQAEFDAMLAAIRARMGEPAYARAWEQGTLLAFDEAAQLALG